MAASRRRKSVRIQVRSARLDQTEIVARIIRRSFAQYRKGRRGPRSAFLTRHQVRRDMRRRHTGYGLAYAGGKPVGAVRYQVAKGRLSFSRLGVLPGYRRRGTGRRLMGWVGLKAKANGARRVQGRILRNLPRLITYYRRLGYAVKRKKKGLAVGSKRVR